MVPFWVSNIIRHLLFKVPKKDHNFDNYPYKTTSQTMKPERHGLPHRMENSIIVRATLQSKDMPGRNSRIRAAGLGLKKRGLDNSNRVWGPIILSL